MNLTKDVIGKLFGNFTWDYKQHFFITTKMGNFIWSDPEYGGDNSIRYTTQSLKEYLAGTEGQSKGNHYINDFCGDNFTLID